MSEPDWKQPLRDWVAVAVGGSDLTQAYALDSLLPHIDAAYERGLTAGRSQGRYTTGRKKWRKEEPCPTSKSAPDASGSGASAGEP